MGGTLQRKTLMSSLVTIIEEHSGERLSSLLGLAIGIPSEQSVPPKAGCSLSPTTKYLVARQALAAKRI